MGDRCAPEWLASITYAHRGLHGPGVPENSLAAAEAAIARGLGIECDIQRSRDDHPMVFHDWGLERLTESSGPTEYLVAEALEELPLLGTDQTPIRLERWLDVVDARVPVLIEIKSQPGYDIEWTCLYVSRILAEYSGRHAVMGFDPRVGEWFATNAPQVCRGLVGTDSYPNGFEGMWRKPRVLRQADPDFLAVDRRDLGRRETAEWRAQGHPLLTWTIRTQDEAEKALTLADAVIAEGEALG
ncbi:MAG: glycerophosphodiester phosphodiesterase family protein [Pseudomonadota bacterium]